jgi:peroxidase
MCRIVTSAIVGVLLLGSGSAQSGAAAAFSATGVVSAARALDGARNNLRHPAWGRSGTPYVRVARANYADGVRTMVAGPPARYVSNRIFNDVGQNLFSENGVTQWGWAWAQFLDHDIGLRDETPAEHAPIAFDALDRLEDFRNELGAIEFARTPAAPGTGVRSQREQINTLSSYIDGSGVYGITARRDLWLREGARLLMTRDRYLPRADARGDVSAAPPMDLMGPLVGRPAAAIVAGDVRANENIALTALHTLFAREHNRIVAALPASLGDEARFQIARRVVGAELQYVTYHEFLPALGVWLHRYRGYNPFVDAAISNEFAVVGYRAHSMIHGEFEDDVPAGRYSPQQLAAFRSAGLTVNRSGDEVELAIPLNVAFGNPGLLHDVGIDPVLESLGERQYRNDEQIDNALRSVLFQVPKSGVRDPSVCGTPTVSASCFSGVLDLGALDIERGRDHGMPYYDDLRRAYGLRPLRSFTDITGERTDRFPEGVTADPLDDRHSLDFVELRDAQGKRIPLGSDEALENAVAGVRRTTLASRLKAIYRDPRRLDAFVGMVSERHVRGAEFGELQLAIWRRQFEALRDGDRYFYAVDPVLRAIERAYHIGYRHTLAEIVRMNTRAKVRDEVFEAGDAD